MRFPRKTVLLVAVLVAGVLCPAHAFTLTKKKKKKTAFTQGQVDLQAGAGFPSLIRPVTDTLLWFGAVTRKASPVFQARLEYAVTNNLGVGLLLGMATSKTTYTDNTDPDNINGFKYSSFIAGGRAAFHLPVKSARFDPYAVGFAGINLMKATPFGPNNPLETDKKVFLWSLHAGANVYFTDKIGAFLELGYGMSVVNAGVTFKFVN